MMKYVTLWLCSHTDRQTDTQTHTHTHTHVHTHCTTYVLYVTYHVTVITDPTAITSEAFLSVTKLLTIARTDGSMTYGYTKTELIITHKHQSHSRNTSDIKYINIIMGVKTGLAFTF